MSHNQQQVVFAWGRGRSLGSADVHGPFCTQGTMVTSWGVGDRLDPEVHVAKGHPAARGPVPSITMLLQKKKKN